jgi:hypothetical protein
MIISVVEEVGFTLSITKEETLFIRFGAANFTITYNYSSRRNYDPLANLVMIVTNYC